MISATDLLATQFDDAKYQLEKVFEGMSETELDFHPFPQMMSAREIGEHLCECYEATIKMVAGEKVEWGSYSLADKSWISLSSEMWSLRDRASSAVLTSGNDKILGEGVFFLAAHDNYHIGQLCLIRIALNADWNPYSIYRISA